MSGALRVTWPVPKAKNDHGIGSGQSCPEKWSGVFLPIGNPDKNFEFFHQKYLLVKKHQTFFSK